MFLINLSYQKSMEEVEKYLNDHVAFLEKYYTLNKFICSGRKNPRTGGIILSCGKDKEEINSIIKEDPFYNNDIAKYEIIEFMPTKYKDGFKEFI